MTLLLLLFLSTALFAQTYPVLVNTSIRAPYSLNLSDYASPSYDRMQSNIYLADLTKTNYPVKIRLVLQGPGISLRTLPGQELGPFFLNGGQTTILTGAEISQLFNPDKLQFTGISKQQYQQNAAIPEGIYQFQLEVLDQNFNTVVSNVNTGFATAWLILNDPPLINVPDKDASITPLTPQNIFFQWTPRHTGSPNSAFTTVYDLQLVEIYPAGRNPNDAMLTSPLIFEKTVYTTAYNYNIADSYLQPDRWYAYRVRARDLNGLDLFKNQGYSEVYRFFYGQPCLVPTQIKTQLVNSTSVLLTWEAPSSYTSIEIQYKAQGGSWNSKTVYENKALIENLIVGKDYAFRLKGFCSNNASTYSEEVTCATVTCNLPIREDVTAKNISATQTLLFWSTTPSFDSYVFRIKDYYDKNAAYKDIETNSATHIAKELTPGFTYQYQIRYRCKTGVWVDGKVGKFTVPIPPNSGTGNCFPPMVLRYVVNKDLSADISWDAEKNVKAYRIFYKPLVASRWDSLESSKEKVTLKNLKADTEYEVFVKCICSDNKPSIAGRKATFKTEFVPAGPCYAPVLLAPTVLSRDQVKLEWKAHSLHSGYVLEYRVYQTGTWMSISTAQTAKVLNELTPAKKYEYRVYALCGLKSSEYSRTDTFSTKGAPVRPLVCGDQKALESITNRTPIATLKEGDVFSAADFQLTVKSLTSAAPYNGEASVKIPYLGYSTFVFGMENARINELGQLYEGKVYLKKVHLAAIDPELAEKINEMLERVDGAFTTFEEFLEEVEKQQERINEYLNEVTGGNNVGFVKTGEIEVTHTVNTTITNASQIKGTTGANGTCNLTITGDDKSTSTISVTPPATIKDNKGTIFAIDNACVATKLAVTIPLTMTREELNQLSSKATVKFVDHPQQKFGFNAWDNTFEKSKLWSARYQLLANSYRVASKFSEPAATDKVKATIVLQDNSVDKSKIIFITGKGLKFTSTFNGSNTYEITIAGGKDGDAQELFAVREISEGKYESYGKLLMPAYRHKKRKVVLVPVGGVAVPTAEIRTTLSSIYNAYGIEWEVSSAASFNDNSWKLDGNDEMQLDETGFVSNLSPEMKALNEAYRKSTEIDPTSIYLFFINKATSEAGKKVEGDMPRAKQFGYVFLDGNTRAQIARTAAHEVGHGLFLLEHTFEGKYDFAQKDLVNNLMDYTVGQKLDKYQWDIMHDPGIVLGVFEKDEDSKSVQALGDKINLLDPNSEGKEVIVSAKNTCNKYLTPNGKVITFTPDHYNRIKKCMIKNGILIGIIDHNNNVYKHSIPVHTISLKTAENINGTSVSQAIDHVSNEIQYVCFDCVIKDNSSVIDVVRDLDLSNTTKVFRKIPIKYKFFFTTNIENCVAGIEVVETFDQTQNLITCKTLSDADCKQFNPEMSCNINPFDTYLYAVSSIDGSKTWGEKIVKAVNRNIVTNAQILTPDILSIDPTGSSYVFTEVSSENNFLSAEVSTKMAYLQLSKGYQFYSSILTVNCEYDQTLANEFAQSVLSLSNVDKSTGIICIAIINNSGASKPITYGLAFGSAVEDQSLIRTTLESFSGPTVEYIYNGLIETYRKIPKKRYVYNYVIFHPRPEDIKKGEVWGNDYVNPIIEGSMFKTGPIEFTNSEGDVIDADYYIVYPDGQSKRLDEKAILKEQYVLRASFSNALYHAEEYARWNVSSTVANYGGSFGGGSLHLSKINIEGCYLSLQKSCTGYETSNKIFNTALSLASIVVPFKYDLILIAAEVIYLSSTGQEADIPLVLTAYSLGYFAGPLIKQASVRSYNIIKSGKESIKSYYKILKINRELKKMELTDKAIQELFERELSPNCIEIFSKNVGHESSFIKIQRNSDNTHDIIHGTVTPNGVNINASWNEKTLRPDLVTNDESKVRAIADDINALVYVDELKAFSDRLDQLGLANLKSKFTSRTDPNRFTSEERWAFRNNFENAIDDELRQLNNETDLLDTWREVSFLRSERNKIEFLQALKTVKTDNVWKHIEGEAHSLTFANGGHYLPNAHVVTDANGIAWIYSDKIRFRVADIRIPNPWSAGQEISKARKIEILNGTTWVPKTGGGTSSFFPSTWSKQRILEETAYVFKKAKADPNTYWTGSGNAYDVLSSDGTTTIQFFYGVNGEVNPLLLGTATPIIKSSFPKY